MMLAALARDCEGKYETLKRRQRLGIVGKLQKCLVVAKSRQSVPTNQLNKETRAIAVLKYTSESLSQFKE